jgi:hypothetical protein
MVSCFGHHFWEFLWRYFYFSAIHYSFLDVPCPFLWSYFGFSATQTYRITRFGNSLWSYFHFSATDLTRFYGRIKKLKYKVAITTNRKGFGSRAFPENTWGSPIACLGWFAVDGSISTTRKEIHHGSLQTDVS